MVASYKRGKSRRNVIQWYGEGDGREMSFLMVNMSDCLTSCSSHWQPAGLLTWHATIMSAQLPTMALIMHIDCLLKHLSHDVSPSTAKTADRKTNSTVAVQLSAKMSYIEPQCGCGKCLKDLFTRMDDQS